MAPEVGFEPTTNRLTADRSTAELLRSDGKRLERKTVNCRDVKVATEGLQAIRSAFP
jgi:hypothetical protein